jgi:hypothetical protein
MRRLCDPAGARTQDPNIKSVMLYQLSYGIIFLCSTIPITIGIRNHIFMLYHPDNYRDKE